MLIFSTERAASSTLNESPSEKEGKYRGAFGRITLNTPSMKVPPKRKGNESHSFLARACFGPSMKVPPKRKGNSSAALRG